MNNLRGSEICGGHFSNGVEGTKMSFKTETKRIRIKGIIESVEVVDIPQEEINIDLKD